jgi:hypothetical protein
MIEAHTHRPKATGSVRAGWRERFGNQHVEITVNPHTTDPDTELRVSTDRRWGPQIGDVRTDSYRLSRQGAETLRDALTAALDWTPEETP